MQSLDKAYPLLVNENINLLYIHEEAKQIVYERSGLIFAFNFHPTASVTDWRVPVPQRTDYRLILNTDDTAYGGQGVVAGGHYPWQDVPMEGWTQSIQSYVPARSALVLATSESVS